MSGPTFAGRVLSGEEIAKVAEVNDITGEPVANIVGALAEMADEDGADFDDELDYLVKIAEDLDDLDTFAQGGSDF